jgi:hypothetical protein
MVVLTEPRMRIVNSYVPFCNKSTEAKMWSPGFTPTCFPSLAFRLGETNKRTSNVPIDSSVPAILLVENAIIVAVPALRPSRNDRLNQINVVDIFNAKPP